MLQHANTPAYSRYHAKEHVERSKSVGMASRGAALAVDKVAYAGAFAPRSPTRKAASSLRVAHSPRSKHTQSPLTRHKSNITHIVDDVHEAPRPLNCDISPLPGLCTTSVSSSPPIPLSDPHSCTKKSGSTPTVDNNQNSIHCPMLANQESTAAQNLERLCISVESSKCVASSNRNSNNSEGTKRQASIRMSCSLTQVTKSGASLLYNSTIGACTNIRSSLGLNEATIESSQRSCPRRGCFLDGHMMQNQTTLAIHPSKTERGHATSTMENGTRVWSQPVINSLSDQPVTVAPRKSSEAISNLIFPLPNSNDVGHTGVVCPKASPEDCDSTASSGRGSQDQGHSISLAALPEFPATCCESMLNATPTSSSSRESSPSRKKRCNIV